MGMAAFAQSFALKRLELSGKRCLWIGLLQRDTEFCNYQDLEARYDLRPSVWIAPRGVGEGPCGIDRDT